MTNRAPIIVAIVLLLLPVLYLGSYLALVVPGFWLPSIPADSNENFNYRYGGMLAAKFFWPLEQIDRKFRPKAWEPRDIRFHRKAPFEHYPSASNG